MPRENGREMNSPSNYKTNDNIQGKLTAGENRQAVMQPSARKRIHDPLPQSTDRSEKWNRIRKVQKASSNTFTRTEDVSVKPEDLSAFIPIKPVEVLDDESLLRDEIRGWIKEYLCMHPRRDFRVFAGLDTRNTPDYIKPFQVELAQGFENARDMFSRMKNQCQNLSTKEAISRTNEGRYLIQMFELEKAPNQEQILKEINTRLHSIAENGEQLLQQTVEIGFENVWIASKELIWDQESKSYMTQLINSDMPNAFVKTVDPQCRIVFLADTFHFDPHVRPGEELKTPVAEAIIHETTHLSSGTVDLLFYSKPPSGYALSGKDLLNDRYTEFHKIAGSLSFKDFVNRLAQQQNLPQLSNKAVKDALSSDHMLRAKLLIEDAELVMTIIRDLSQGRAIDERPRVRRTQEQDITKTERKVEGKLPDIKNETEKMRLSDAIVIGKERSRSASGTKPNQSLERIQNVDSHR